MIKLPLKRKNRIIVCHMETQHLHDAAAIHAACFRDAWGDGTLTNMLSQRGMTGLAACTSPKKISGFMIYRSVAGEVEIITIATSPKARRKGIARALMEEMIRRSLADRCETVFLEVDETNEAARKLYAGLGFRKVGERKGYYHSSPSTDEKGGNIPAANAHILRLDLKRS